MTSGILIFEDMQAGILPGDISLECKNSQSISPDIILSTAYNVLPIWIRIAHDNLGQAKQASLTISKEWPEDSGHQKELLILELEPSLQVFVSCGIALDALYDQLHVISSRGF